MHKKCEATRGTCLSKWPVENVQVLVVVLAFILAGLRRQAQDYYYRKMTRAIQCCPQESTECTIYSTCERFSFYHSNNRKLHALPPSFTIKDDVMRSWYRIVLNFLRIVSFEDFVEICKFPECARRTAHTPGLSNTWHHIVISSNLQLLAKQCLLEGNFMERVSCGFSSLTLGCCPSMLLQAVWKVCVVHQKFLLKYFHKQWKI